MAGEITSDESIHITIPAALDMVWDTTEVDATIYTGAGLISPTVSYSGDKKTLMLDVASVFSDGNTLTVGGFFLKDFGIANGVMTTTGALVMTLGNDLTVEQTDTRTKTISRFSGITKYYINANGDFNTDNNWSLSSGGAPNTTAPGAGDLAVFDAASGVCHLDSAAALDSVMLTAGYDDVLSLGSYAFELTGDLSIYAGDIDAGSAAVLVGGDVLVSGGTFTAGSSVVTLNGTSRQEITSGATVFSELKVTNVAAQGVSFLDGWRAGTFRAVADDTTLIFHYGADYTVDTLLVLGGSSEGNEVVLQSDVPGSSFALVVGQNYNFGYLEVTDSEVNSAVGGVTGITVTNYINGGGNDDGEVAPHWVFSGPVSRYWVGAVDSSWHTAGNWSSSSGGAGGAGVPGAADTAIFDRTNAVVTATIWPGVPESIQLLSGFGGTFAPAAAISVANGVVINSGTLDLSVNNAPLTLGGGFVVGSSGTFVAGSGTVTIAGTSATYANVDKDKTTWPSNGLLVIQSDTDQHLPAGEDYGSLTLRRFTAGGTTAYTMGSVIHGDWTIDVGTVAHMSDNITVDGNVVVTGALETHGYDLHIAGSLTVTGSIDGTDDLVVDTQIYVGGNANFTGGALTPGDSTFIFDGNTSLTSGGVAFYDVRIGSSGAGGQLTALDTMNVDHSLYAGSVGVTGLDITGRTLFVAGDMDISALNTFTSTGSVVILDGTQAQALTSGPAVFAELRVTNAVVAGVSFVDAWRAATFRAVENSTNLIFHASADYTVDTALYLGGSSAGNEVWLRSDTLHSPFALVVGQDYSFSFLGVTDSQVNSLVGGVTGITITNFINGGGNDNAAAAPHWVFSGTGSSVWSGAVDTDWNNGLNWVSGIVPVAGDAVTIPAAPVNQPALTGLRDITVQSLTIQSGATLTLDQCPIVLTGSLVNQGTIVLDGNETMTAASMTDSGIIKYVGMSDSEVLVNMANRFVIGGSAKTTFNTIVIQEENIAALRDTFRASSSMTVTQSFTLVEGAFTVYSGRTLTTNGNLLVQGGTFTATSAVLDVTNIAISGGTFLAPVATAFTVSGNFAHTAGVFTPGAGTVTLDGAMQTMSGNTTFYRLRKIMPSVAACSLIFESGKRRL